MFNNGLSPADLAAVTGSNNGGFFGNEGLWAVIILAIIFGWGNGGNVFGGGSCGVSDGYVLASDFSNIERKIDTVNSGLCDGFYAMNTGMLNGFSNAELARANGQATILQQMNNNAVSQMQTGFALQSQLADCCCQNRESIANLNYNLATQSCATNNAIANSTRDIVDNQNANTRAILDKLSAQEVNALNDKIATLTADNQALRFGASQQMQNAYLISRLQPTPVPSYPATNLYGYYGTTIA